MRITLAAVIAVAVIALGAPHGTAAAAEEDDAPRTVLYEGPNAVSIPYLAEVTASMADGWRIVDCGAVRAQSSLIVDCTPDGFTARADAYDPSYGHDLVDVAMTNGRVSTTIQYVVQLAPPEVPETSVSAYPYPAPAGGSLLIPISDLGLSCQACADGGVIEAFSVAPSGAARLSVTETHVIVRPASDFSGPLTVSLRFADQFEDWSQPFELTVPVSQLSDDAPRAIATYAAMPEVPAEFDVAQFVAGDADRVQIVGCGEALHGHVSCGAGDVVRYAPTPDAVVDQFSVQLARGPDLVTASLTLVRPHQDVGLPTEGLAPVHSDASERVPRAELEAAQAAAEEAAAEEQAAAEEEAAANGDPVPQQPADEGGEPDLVGLRVATPLGPPPPPAEEAPAGVFTGLLAVLDRMD